MPIWQRLNRIRACFDGRHQMLKYLSCVFFALTKMISVMTLSVRPYDLVARYKRHIFLEQLRFVIGQFISTHLSDCKLAISKAPACAVTCRGLWTICTHANCADRKTSTRRKFMAHAIPRMQSLACNPRRSQESRGRIHMRCYMASVFKN
jgi:hypothetical protein